MGVTRKGVKKKFSDVMKEHGIKGTPATEAKAPRNPDAKFITGFGGKPGAPSRTTHEIPGKSDQKLQVYKDGSWEHKEVDDVNETSTRLGSGQGADELHDYLTSKGI